jgi:protein farnesyltransferase subunit beta
MLDDDKRTPTSIEQTQLEEEVAAIFQAFWEHAEQDSSNSPALARQKHTAYLLGALGALPAGYCSLDSAQPWVTFWACQGLHLLGYDFKQSEHPNNVIRFLRSCQHPTGGFCGGPAQLPHLAPTYAAIAALVTIGTEEALEVVDRPALRHFLLRMCVPAHRAGGMTVHEGGEIDIRACYLAIASAYLAGLDVQEVAKEGSVVSYICRCQTHEGGLGGEPGNEAHGGYTYCGLAALMLLQQGAALNAPAVAAAATQRQAWLEGGFSGRTNKLADGCYSFWQGALFPMLQELGPLRPRMPNWACQAEARLSVPSLPEAMRCPSSLCEIQRKDSNDPGTRHDEGFGTHSNLVGVSMSAAAASSDLHPESLLERLSSHAAHDSSDRPSLGLCKPAKPPENDLGNHTSQRQLLFDARALQAWILVACQDRKGLRDKPGKRADFYHTCYCLSGLASCQAYCKKVLGDGETNWLLATDPLVNVGPAKLQRAQAFFASRPVR